MDEIIFKDYRDPFRAFNIHMSIICDLEQGGKITEEEAFTQIKDLEIPTIYSMEPKRFFQSNLLKKLWLLFRLLIEFLLLTIGL